MIDFIKKLWKGDGRRLAQRQEQVTIGIQNNLVVMDFHRPIAFISMDAMTAYKMGSAIKKRAQECMKMGGSSPGKK